MPLRTRRDHLVYVGPVPTAAPASLPQPRFHLAFQELEARIERGELGPGDRLPSERWLADDLSVSRTTVRRALDELLGRGLVEDDGRGGLVVPGRARADNRMQGLTELARARGLLATSRVLLAEERPADLDDAEAFAIAPGSPVLHLHRLRSLDGLAVSVDRDRLAARSLPRWAELDLTTASLYGALEDAGHELGVHRTQIEAAAASKEEARLLGLEAGAPVLVASGTTSDRTGRAVSIGRTAYRSDRHRFLTTFVRAR